MNDHDPRTFAHRVLMLAEAADYLIASGKPFGLFVGGAILRFLEQCSSGKKKKALHWFLGIVIPKSHRTAQSVFRDLRRDD